MNIVKVLTTLQVIFFVWSCAVLAEDRKGLEPGSGSYSVVGIGPGDADLLTARAFSAIRNADIVFCDSEARERLAGLVDFQGKQVLNGYGGLSRFYGKDCSTLSVEERTHFGMTCEAYKEKQKEFASLVRKAIAGGKHVVMLSPGDPTLYGQDTWTVTELGDLNPLVVPGMSTFNAANSTRQVGLGDVAMTTPLQGKAGDQVRDSIENLARHERATLVVFMPGEMKRLLNRLSEACPGDTPVAVVSHAGQKGKTTVVNGTVADLVQKLDGIDDHPSLVYVGTALKEARDLESSSRKPKGSGKFFLVGAGPGDSDLATLRALEVIRQADVVFAAKRISDRFEKELAGKAPIDGYHRLFPFYGKKCSELSEQEKAREKMTCEEYHQKQAEFAAMVRKAVGEGKAVVLLDSGDPLIYGPSAWTLREFTDIEAEVVPGLSCFNAANAALGQGIADMDRFHSVILASGWSVAEMAALRSTMAIFTMRTDFQKFIDTLSLHYPPETPVAIVASAGYADREKVLRTRLKDVMGQKSHLNLPFEYMIYVGDVLEAGAGR